MILSSDKPAWWNDQLRDECILLAKRALPNEAFGLVCRLSPGNDPEIVTFPGFSTETQFDAEAQSVIRFAYRLLATNGTVLASFHSHPNGRTSLSRRDCSLFDWARVHILLSRTNDGWTLMFHTSSSEDLHISL